MKKYSDSVVFERDSFFCIPSDHVRGWTERMPFSSQLSPLVVLLRCIVYTTCGATDTGQTRSEISTRRVLKMPSTKCSWLKGERRGIFCEWLSNLCLDGVTLSLLSIWSELICAATLRACWIKMIKNFILKLLIRILFKKQRFNLVDSLSKRNKT